MKILLVYPKYPNTFWSFKHVLKFVSKKAAYPPLGLLTVAAILPGNWEKKLVDMNVDSLDDTDLKWADYVFISAMITQKDSAIEVINKCKQLNIKIVGGGPLFTTGYQEFEEVDHLILGEAESSLPIFLKDLQEGKPQKRYASDTWPNVSKTPVPLWSLINVKHYAAMLVQYSRGCPFDCEFCDIPILNGHKPRTKEIDQFIREFDVLYEHGWRGAVFVVDDNFIGNKNKVKKLLRELIIWMEKHKHPFSLLTESSLNLVDDEELMELMVMAGFRRVFVGIESPAEESLVECNKFQNRNRNMIAAIKKIQNFGMEVQGGFIVGFDNDPPSIFDRQIKFIQESGVVTAMVGLLNALPETKLYKRLKKECRLLANSSGNNTDISLNFIPKMDNELIIDGYKKILSTIYSHKKYYERIITFLQEYHPVRRGKPDFYDCMAFLKSIWFLGIVGKGKKYYWKLLLLSLFKYRRGLTEAITLAIYGLHFRRVLRDLDL